jgi:hypothetical protein
VYGCKLPDAPLWTCWSGGMITKFRPGAGRSGALDWVGLMGEPEAILFGDSVRSIGGDLSFSRSSSRSRGIFASTPFCFSGAPGFESETELIYYRL